MKNSAYLPDHKLHSIVFVVFSLEGCELCHDLWVQGWLLAVTGVQAVSGVCDLVRVRGLHFGHG